MNGIRNVNMEIEREPNKKNDLYKEIVIWKYICICYTT